MARNKYPEETVARILDASLDLFTTKGFDNVTIQDIVDNLGGLTKGAIYHHFKNKSEIFDAVVDRQRREYSIFADVAREADLSGLERLRMFLRRYLSDSSHRSVYHAADSSASNSAVLVKEMKDVIQVIAPYVRRFIEMGNSDGSLEVAYPKQVAEIAVFLVHIWLNPKIIPSSGEEFRDKTFFVKAMLDSMGMPLVDDEIMDFFEVVYQEVKLQLGQTSASAY